jgi:hypothetical protein
VETRRFFRSAPPRRQPFKESRQTFPSRVHSPIEKAAAASRRRLQPSPKKISKNMEKKIMRNLYQLFAGLALALAIGASALAQTHTQTVKSPEITIIIQPQQVRFTAAGEAQEWRLEIRNQAGEMIFDSGFASDSEIVWPLQNADGQAVASGLYAYTLTIKESRKEAAQTRRGHLIVDLARDRQSQADRLWITSQSADVGVELNGSEVTVARGDDAAVAGVRAANAQSSVMAPPPPLVRGSGTVNQITKWTATDEIGDSVIAESGGNIGVGIAAPTAKLQVAGIIHSTTGGVKFPDGSVQTTAASGGVTSVTASGPLASNGGATPNVSLTGVVPIANGGTGSATKNFVDLTTTQTVAGAKTFSNAVNTTAQYNINGLRVLGNPGNSNLFAGEGAGVNNLGEYNAFFGREAGVNNTTGSTNAFFGAHAGFSNSDGGSNSFFGPGAGFNNTSGFGNAFFGRDVGYNNTTGFYNSFFGGAGVSNTTGNHNSFFGIAAGGYNTEGTNNSFFGRSAGNNNTIGSYNTIIGWKRVCPTPMKAITPSSEPEPMARWASATRRPLARALP